MLDDLSFAQPFIERTGWTLLHFLWQGTLVALLLAGALQLLRRRSAKLRYAVCLAALLLLALLPAVTWLSLAEPASVTSHEPPSVLAADVPALYGATSTLDAPTDPSWQDRLHAATQALLPWGVGAWALGVLLLSGRLLGGWLRVRRLRIRTVQPAAAAWEDRLARLSEQMDLARPVQLLQSALVESPVAVGWMRPVILTPVGFFAGLPPEQVEAILAHELAHLRRHDYLVNLMQSVVETLLFYHPAVWWVSRRVRLEREYCCDDAAAAACRDRLTCARALAELEARRSGGARLLAPAASDGALLRRIRRLIGDAPAPISSPSHVAAGCLLLGAAVTFVLACAPEPTQAGHAAPNPAPATAQIAPADTSRPDSARSASSIIIRGDLPAEEDSLFGGQVLFLDGDSLRTVIERHIDGLQLDSLVSPHPPLPPLPALGVGPRADSLEKQIRETMRSVEQNLDSLREAGVFDVERYMRRLDQQMQHLNPANILPEDHLQEAIRQLERLAQHPPVPSQPDVDSLLRRHQHQADSLALRHQRRMQKRQAFLQRRQKAMQKNQERRRAEQRVRMLEERARRMREEAEKMQEEAERLREKYARRQEEEASGAERE